MKNLVPKILLAILIIMNFNSYVYAEKESQYLTLTEVDRNTFNEYGYKITQQLFRLREGFEINGSIDVEAARRIAQLAADGHKYLPDNLLNDNYLSLLKAKVQKGINNPDIDANYQGIVNAVTDYIDNSKINVIKGDIVAFPNEGNAPLTVTLKGIVEDDSGSNLLDHNYTWWLDIGGKRKIIGNKPTIKYTFTREGKTTVFLEVKSNHRNKLGKTDVLPFKGSTIINIKSRIASVIVNINGKKLENQSIIKFEPIESSYGLIFDATSSTPTQGTEFEKTTWDFGNGIKKSYKGKPKIERIPFTTEGEFDVILGLETNEGKIVKKEFQIVIRKPIATIKASQEEGFLGDKFIFTSKTTSKDKNIIYSWEVIDIDNEKIIMKKSGKIFNYQFSTKGKFNIKLKVRNAAGESDIDTKVIYIKSKSPVASFVTSIPEKNKPNYVLIDASKSYDPDFTDDGTLKYYWIIEGKRVDLKNSNESGSMGYMSFDTIGEKSISLEVRDSDGISDIKKGTVTIKSILSVDFRTLPKVIKRNGYVQFRSTSPEARVYNWYFGDGQEKEGGSKKETHYFRQSGKFKVKLEVSDKNDNINSLTKLVYVAESNEPLAIIDIQPTGSTSSQSKSTLFKEKQCEADGKKEGAYIVDRTSSISMKSSNSINIDGKNNGLKYSWKLDNGKLFSESSISYKYDEIGCHKVKLTVTSEKEGKSNSTHTWLKIVNLKPTIKALNLSIKDENSDPIIVTATAIGATDPDGVIQSYLWYYYTDSDNEPQGFRATRLNFTTFVLPKIAGKYHFMLIMKDNNEGKTETLKGENSITISGDNINTPLINIGVNDNSISTGQEIVFESTVDNIIGDDLTNKATYSWDFDGDGFYDVETSKSTVTHKYKKSGEFHAKVKVKYKGFSNVKTVTINVENKLEANFEYISIGNKFIFFNNSNGTVKSMVWDMGNGDKIRGRNNFIYTYKDKEKSHKVKLNISEGSKNSIKERRVIKKVSNILKARKKGINIFSIPDLGEDNNIVLKNQTDNLFLYIGESRGDYEYFPIDFDIEYDSDLNGGKDDDEDNKGEESYSSGAPLKVPLNNKKEQNIKLFFRGSEQELLDTIDIKIIKEYIEEKPDIDPTENKDFFASESDKEIIKEIKELIGLLPEENRKKALSYITKIQNNWTDATEKTRTIIEFEEYLDSIQSNQTEDIFDLLETLLIEDDGGSANININALRKLVPENIVCEEMGEFESCYEYVIDILEQINNSNDIEKNKQLGGEILDIISKQSEDIITVKQGFDFKAILKSLIYGGTIEIPLCEEGQIENEDCRTPPLETCKNGETENCIQPIESNDNKGGSLLGTIGKWLMFALFILLGWFFIVFIYYKLTNKNESAGFDDFIMEKTNPGEEKEVDVLGGIDSNKKKKVVEKNEDILGESKKTPNTVLSKNNDIFSSNTTTNEKVKDKNSTTPPPKQPKDEKVPSWLNLENGDKPNKKTEKKDEVFSSIKNNNKDNKKDDKKTSINSKIKSNTPITKKENTLNTSEKGEKNIFEGIEKDETPDWLKGSPSETKKPDTKALNKKDNTEKKPIINKKEKASDNTPDWLKGSFSETKETDKKIVKQETGTNNTNNKPNLKTDNNKSNTEKVIEKNIITEKTIISEKKVEAKSNSTPDWLKDNSSIDKKEEIKKEKTPNLTEKINLKQDITKVDKENIKVKKEVNNKKDTKNIIPKTITNDKSLLDDNIIEIKKEENNEKTIISDEKNKTKNETPDWLKNDIFENKDTKNSKIDTKTEEKNINSDEKADKTSETPDWLKNEHFKEKEKNKSGSSINGKSIEVPDWLSGDKLDNKKIKNNDIKLTTPTELKEKETIEKTSIPETKVETKIDDKIDDKIKNVKNIKSKTLEIDLSPDTTKKEETNNKDLKIIPKTDTIKVNKDTPINTGTDKPIEKKTEINKTNESDKKKNDDMELWDDGMKVPDWLKTNDDK